MALFRAVPRTRRRETILTNEQRTFYEYDLTPEQLAELERQIQAAIDAQVLETTGERMPDDWWWQDRIEPPYRRGTGDEIVDFNQAVAAALAAGFVVESFRTQPIDFALVLQSQEYQEALQNIYVRNFASLKGLSDRTAARVKQVINAGMVAGLTPTDIVDNIVDRFDVSRSDAKRTADTAVNAAYNDARLDATTAAARVSGLRTAVIHISALLPTSRDTHVNRHGNAYTVSQQRQWWDSGSNRINCHCTTRTVLIDRRGRLFDIEIQQEIKAERDLS